MYQYTTTNVINSAKALDYNGNILIDGNGSEIARYTGTSTVFNVPKIGKFLKTGIVSVYKRPYSAGVLEVNQITVPTPTSGDVLRLTVNLKLSQSTLSEYTNYSMDFKLPVVVEIISSGNASTDATAIVAQLNALKNRFGKTYFTATVGSGGTSAQITLTAKEHTQRFESVVLSKAVANTSSLTMYDQTSIATGAVTTAGAIGFGDDAWMIRSLFIPTAENVRYFGISREERPILGGNYTEYALRYSIAKDGMDGIVGGGTSITTHIFYVKSDLVTSFEAALLVTWPTLVTIGGDSDLVIIGDQTIGVGAAQTTLTTVNASGAVTWASGTVGVATINRRTVY